MYQRSFSKLLARFFNGRHCPPRCKGRSLFHVLSSDYAETTNLLSYNLSRCSSNNYVRTYPCFVSKRSKCSPASEEGSLAKRLVERWVYEVDPFGKLEIASPMDVEISSLNPHEYPEMNRVIVTVLTKADGQNINGGAFADLYNMQTELCPERKTLTVTYNMTDGVVVPVVCSIKVPVKFDLKVRNTHPASVSVSEIECEHIDIVLNNGDCNLKKIKCGEASVDCTDGNIACSTLQGNINLKTQRHGNIKADRLQGLTVMCGTEFGNMDIKTLYSGRNKFSCCHGNVHVGSCHGNTFVKIDTGNLNIDTLNGSLRADIQSGNVDVFIEPDMQHEHVDITCDAGDVNIKCTDSLESKVDVVADTLSVDSNIVFEHTSTPHEKQTKYSGFLKKEDGGKILVHTKQGAVTISAQTWLSSIGLKFRDS